HSVPALDALLRKVEVLHASFPPVPQPHLTGDPLRRDAALSPCPRALSQGQTTPSYPNGSETVVIAPFSKSVISATAWSPCTFGVTLTACAPGWAVSAAVT